MSRTTSKPPDWTEMVLKCDGNHGGPACGDPECWAIDWKIQCSSCLYKEVNRSNHWCYMFKDPPTDWCVPWRPVKTEGVPEDLSQATSPDPRDAEIARLKGLAEKYETEWGKCSAFANRVIGEKDAEIATLNRELEEACEDRARIYADNERLRAVLQELRIRYHAAGRRPEECYEMSLIDEALRGEEK
jgi:hypothetical protein